MGVSPAAIVHFHTAGRWSPAQVHVRRIPGSGRRIVPEVEAAIERAWEAAISRPGVHLFDGRMCRLESWEASESSLQLVLSETSYKPFLGTNLTHPEVSDRYGPEILANPAGVSPALVTADGYLMMGRRNASVAYYPNRIHPFAGALDPADADPFAAIRRELGEELGFAADDIAEDGIHCTGIAEDISIRQPELMFSVQSTRRSWEIESRLDSTEHHAALKVPASDDGIRQALMSGEAFTPVGLAAMALWGRQALGAEWFRKTIAALSFSSRGS